MKLEVVWGNQKDVHEVMPHVNLFHVLQEKYALLPEFPWNTEGFRTDCGGNGRCKKCNVLLEGGIAEYKGKVVFGKGQSLPACQIFLLSDGTVRLSGQPQFALPEGRVQKKETKEAEEETKEEAAEKDSCGCGIAVDIGTTNLKFAKVRLLDGAVLKTYQCRNSQGSYGADVMARITAACKGDQEKLTALVHSDIKKGIEALFALPEQRPRKISFVCNTTMLSLLCGFPLDGMREHPFTPHCLKVPQKEWNGAAVCFAPCAGAFIGGDIVAGLAVLPWEEKPLLLIDLGTNGELVFGTREKLLAVSVAAGPAFESGGWEKGTSALAALAEACRNGAVDETGLLSEPYFETGYPFYAEDGSRAGTLTQSAIRDLQLAKAAVRVGVEYLLSKSPFGMPHKIYLAGNMGNLKEEDCIEIGMLPECFLGKTEFLGNTALAGAIRMLTDASAYDAMKELAGRIEEHELAGWEGFGESYLDYLNLPEKKTKRG